MGGGPRARKVGPGGVRGRFTARGPGTFWRPRAVSARSSAPARPTSGFEIGSVRYVLLEKVPSAVVSAEVRSEASRRRGLTGASGSISRPHENDIAISPLNAAAIFSFSWEPAVLSRRRGSPIAFKTESLIRSRLPWSESAL